MHMRQQQDSATAAAAIQSDNLWKVTTGHANMVCTYADVLPIKVFFLFSSRSVTPGQSTVHAGGGVVVWEIVL